MPYSAEQGLFQSLLAEERMLSAKYADLLSSSATAELQNKLQYIQRTNNETVAMLIAEADSRGYIKK